ncbi:MAG: prepilin-type N-terminal cleavage/methylation domain-containing protein, partial [Candidatus Ratteibacteria bacterium]|nr:prepilin-type N-terminal cleavage/methylation domain-containing protein [Candidatus Ratteibacteria bacterium]
MLKKTIKSKLGFTPLEMNSKQKDLIPKKNLLINSTSKIFTGFYRNAKRHFLSLTGFTLTELMIVTSILGAV